MNNMGYKVRFVNYPEHYGRMWDDIMGAVSGCLSRGDLIARQQLDDFEGNLAKYIGVKHVVGVNSGTDALIISLRAAGLKPGDEVITVSHTFVATITSIVLNGGTPKLVDVGPDMEMDVSKLEKAVTKKTKGIIPVHLNGRMTDMRAVHEVADKHGLFVVEDAAQALGAKVGKYVSGGSGLTGCFSFYPAKILGCAGDGGALSTNDDDIATKARLLRDHGFKRDTNELLLYGYNSRLDNIQAAMLDVKLRHLPEWIERRRAIADMYEEGLSGVGDLILMPGTEGADGYFDVYQNYVVRTGRRDALFAHMKEQGVETLISWPKATHTHPALGLTHFSLPETEKLSRTVLSLPMFPELEDSEVEYVIEAVKAFYRK